MKVKNLPLVVAIAACALLAVPALASGAVWKHKGANLAKFVELKMSGGELFETSAGNGMSCEVKATMTTEGGSTAKITNFAINACPTGFGTFAGCQINTAEAKGLPWTVHVNSTDLTITNMRTKRTFKAGCATAELDKTIGSTTVTLETPSAISELNYSGSITGYKTIGTLTIEGSNKGTYGIG
jgi:hypothetical protein